VCYELFLDLRDVHVLGQWSEFLVHDCLDLFHMRSGSWRAWRASDSISFASMSGASLSRSAQTGQVSELGS
jgi:hypothetical protein